MSLGHHSAFVSPSHNLLRLETNQNKESDRQAVCGCWRVKTACLVIVVALTPKQHDLCPITSSDCPAHTHTEMTIKKSLNADCVANLGSDSRDQGPKQRLSKRRETERNTAVSPARVPWAKQQSTAFRGHP